MLDIVDLHDFYHTSLGQHCRRRIGTIIESIWPDLKHLAVLGLGYPIPYLDAYLGKAERICMMMSARQGVAHWPIGQDNATALIDYDAIPLADSSIDRILLTHALEYSETPNALMREVWRVLRENGRVLVITPNRRSIWAQLDDSPFGVGNPYTLAQLSRLLRELQFTPTQSARGLYIFPSHYRIVQSTFPIFDSVGSVVFKKFSGIVAIEAVKQVYANILFKEKKVYSPAVIRPRTPTISG